nr:hypothetical protein Iba_chr05dCG7420 [Ipomoea batatas]GMC97485.1 hypothetical protein Iba_chr05dCG7450 [Ipomoea batatas]
MEGGIAELSRFHSKIKILKDWFGQLVIKSFGKSKVKSLARRLRCDNKGIAWEFRPIWSFQIIHSQIQYLSCVNCPTSTGIAPVKLLLLKSRKVSLRRATDSRWDHSAKTIVVEINATGVADDALPTAHICEVVDRPERIQPCPLGLVGHPSADSGPFGIQSSDTEPISRRFLHETVESGARTPSRHEHMKKFGKTNGRALDGLV